MLFLTYGVMTNPARLFSIPSRPFAGCRSLPTSKPLLTLTPFTMGLPLSSCFPFPQPEPLHTPINNQDFASFVVSRAGRLSRADNRPSAGCLESSKVIRCY